MRVAITKTTQPDNARADIKTSLQAMWGKIAETVEPGKPTTVLWSVMSTPFVDLKTGTAETQHTSIMAEIKT